MRENERPNSEYPRRTGNVIGSFGYDIRHLKRRVERIERRLGLGDEDAHDGQTRGDSRGNDQG